MGKENTAQTLVNKKPTERLNTGSRKYWTKERSQIEAKKYKSRSEFQKKSKGCYLSCLRGGFLDEVCVHMDTHKRPNGYWTIERIKKEALKHNSRKDFEKLSFPAYMAARRYGVMDVVCSHMIRLVNKGGYWSYENCMKEAAKYNSKTRFKEGSPGAHNACYRNGWLEDVCNHMTGGYEKSDTIYIWEIVSSICDRAYKIGVRKSNISKMYRANQVANSIGVGIGRYFEVVVGSDNAIRIEQEIIKSHKKCNLFSGDGSTEIIYLNKSEYDQVKNRMKENETKKI